MEIVKLLISSGADVNIRNNRGYSAVNLASDDTIRNILIEAGLDKVLY